MKNKPNESEGPEEAYISILPEKSHKIKKGSSHKKHNQFVSFDFKILVIVSFIYGENFGKSF